MEDARLGEPVVRQSPYAVPSEPVILTSPPKRAPPQVDDPVPKRAKRPAVSRDCIIGKVPGYDLPQPFPLFGNRMVHSTPELRLNVQELRPQAVAPGLPLNLEGSL